MKTWIVGTGTRSVRTAVAEMLRAEFVEALRAKGLRESRVFVHVAKDIAPVALAVLGLQFGYLLGGSILVETVFSWPGTGLLLNNAIFRRDITVLQGTVLVLALFFVVVNAVVDVLQAVADPRIGRGWTVPGVTLSSEHTPASAKRWDGYWAGVARRLRTSNLTMLALLVLGIIAISSAFAPWIVPQDPYKTSMLHRLAPLLSSGHALGTDELGRDMLARLVFGGRLSLLIGLGPVLAAFVLGGTLGIIAGCAGGSVNTLIMRIMDVFYAFPSVLLAIAIAGALGAGVGNTLLSLTIVFVPPITRIAESVATQVRGLDFIEAARASGAGNVAILRVHVLRNVLGPTAVFATSLVSVSIILGSGLSFLGLGAEPPLAEWGAMLNALRQAVWINPAVAILPGVMILIVSICFNLMSDGLRAAMEVRD